MNPPMAQVPAARPCMLEVVRGDRWNSREGVPVVG